MKSTIIYFSGTGNSLAFSRLLAKKLPESTVSSANEMLRRRPPLLETGICGFVFPVYCQNVPEIVQRLARRMEFSGTTYIFAVATHNGDPGYSHFTLDKIFKKKGQRLGAGFAVLMPGNCITPTDSTNSENEVHRRIEASYSRADEIAKKIVKRPTLPFQGSASFKKRLKGLRNMFRFKVAYKVPDSFWVTDACNLCGLCERVCPENNISIDSGLPEWGKNCQICLACIHWCPQCAIQNGAGTIDRIRYHHPDISIDDMLLKNIIKK